MSLASVQEDKARLLLVHSCTHLLGIQSIAEFPCPDGRHQFEVAPAVLQFSVLVDDGVCCKMVT